MSCLMILLLPNTPHQTMWPTTPITHSSQPQLPLTPTVTSSTLQSDNTLPNNLPPIYQPTSQANSKPVTRSQNDIFKPNQKYYGLHTHITKSPLPKNPMSALMSHKLVFFYILFESVLFRYFVFLFPF